MEKTSKVLFNQRFDRKRCESALVLYYRGSLDVVIFGLVKLSLVLIDALSLSQQSPSHG